MAGHFEKRRHEGDDQDRLTCRDCGFIAYENPKIVVGSVVAVPRAGGDDAVLLCRRAIEPRRGFWTLPAGYLEMGETVEEGARREAWEEARARIETQGVLAVYSIARFGQVQVMFRARLGAPDFAAGPESLEVRAFAWDDIPWDDIAFPTVRWALQAWREGAGHPGPAVLNPPEDIRGTRPLPGPVLAEDAG